MSDGNEFKMQDFEMVEESQLPDPTPAADGGTFVDQIFALSGDIYGILLVVTGIWFVGSLMTGMPNFKVALAFICLIVLGSFF